MRFPLPRVATRSRASRERSTTCGAAGGALHRQGNEEGRRWTATKHVSPQCNGRRAPPHPRNKL